MTIEEFAEKARGVVIGSVAKHTPQDILNAGTYQGFTDEEIQGLVDFLVSCAHSDEEAKSFTAAYTVEMNETIALRKQEYEDRKAKFTEVFNTVTERGRIGSDGFPVEGGNNE